MVQIIGAARAAGVELFIGENNNDLVTAKILINILSTESSSYVQSTILNYLKNSSSLRDDSTILNELDTRDAFRKYFQVIEIIPVAFVNPFNDG